MTEIRFEWDPGKARTNFAKHGVSFEEAASAFYDEFGLLIDDPEHSEREDRSVLLGLSSFLRVLVVVHCFRQQDDSIRIISARQATRRETDLYQAQMRL